MNGFKAYVQSQETMEAIVHSKETHLKDGLPAQNCPKSPPETSRKCRFATRVVVVSEDEAVDTALVHEHCVHIDALPATVL